VAQYVHYNLTADDLKLQNPIYNRILEEANEHSNDEGFKAEQYFIHHPDIEVSQIATALATDRFVLSESQQVKVTSESIRRDVMHLLLDFRLDIVEGRLKDLKLQITAARNDRDRLMELMAQFKDYQIIRNQLAKQLGNDIIIR
jgi:DNA primase